MNKEFIVGEITAAMRAQDKPRLAILRLVKNEIDVKEKDAKRDLTDEERQHWREQKRPQPRQQAYAHHAQQRRRAQYRR